jgi:putative tricarboxylic transport membrane protein
MLETNAILSYQVSGGDASYVLERPAAVAIVAAMFLSIGFNAWKKRRRARKESSRETLTSATPQVGARG